MKILFVCTGNAGRSQMAEAMFRAAHGEEFEVLSAGVEPWGKLHPMAVTLMAEDGLDMSGHYPKHVDSFLDKKINIVVTIGDRAKSETKYFSADVKIIHWDINDPADADNTPDSEKVFRYTKKAILSRFPTLLEFARNCSYKDACLQPGISTCILRFEDTFGKEAGEYAFKPKEHLPLLKKNGFDFIEFCCYFEPDFNWKDKKAITELDKIAIDNDISIWSVHTPELNLNHNTENLSQKLDTVKRFVEICQELKSQNLVLHYFPEVELENNQLPDIFNKLDLLVNETPVVLCLETLQQKEKNQRLMKLFNYLNSSSFGAIVDVGHNFIAGDLYGQISKLGNKLKGLHLHDNNGEVDQHQAIGSGLIDWKQIIKELHEINFQGPLLLEVDEKVHSSKIDSFLKQCIKSIEKI